LIHFIIYKREWSIYVLRHSSLQDVGFCYQDTKLANIGNFHSRKIKKINKRTVTIEIDWHHYRWKEHKF